MTLLEKLLYIADYMEPTRDFPGWSTCRRWPMRIWTRRCSWVRDEHTGDGRQGLPSAPQYGKGPGLAAGARRKELVIDEPGTEKEPPGRRPGTEAGESPAGKRPSGRKPGRSCTKKQKILLGLYIALTVVAAIIVAGAIVFGLMSAPAGGGPPTPPPALPSSTSRVRR